MLRILLSCLVLCLALYATASPAATTSTADLELAKAIVAAELRLVPVKKYDGLSRFDDTTCTQGLLKLELSNEYALGEPIIGKVTLTNPTQHPVQCRISEVQDCGFPSPLSVVVRDDKGTTLPHQTLVSDQTGSLHRSVRQNGTLSFPVLLNLYLPSMRPGRYSVRLEYRGQVDSTGHGEGLVAKSEPVSFRIDGRDFSGTAKQVQERFTLAGLSVPSFLAAGFINDTSRIRELVSICAKVRIQTNVINEPIQEQRILDHEYAALALLLMRDKALF